MISLVLVFFSHTTAQARVGGGRSFGSRGSRMTAPRSYPSSPAHSNSNPYAAPRGQAPGAAPYGAPAQSAPPPSFGGGGFMRGMAGGLMGGMLGSMLFRNQGWGGDGSIGGGRGGIGLLDLLLFAGLAFFIFRWFKQRNEVSYASSAPQGYSPSYAETATQAAAVPVQDERDIASVLSQSDPSFDLTAFKEARTDDFFKIQAALMNRELGPVREKVTSEILSILESDVARLKESGKINRIENIAVREAEIAEAWVESGQQYATLRLKASLLDYTVDDKTGAIISGSNTEPIKFQEHWTFMRWGSSGPWKLSAIENNI